MVFRVFYIKLHIRYKLNAIYQFFFSFNINLYKRYTKNTIYSYVIFIKIKALSIMNQIAERINELRIKKGWSQYNLAKATGISENTVYGWTRNNVTPSLKNVEAICEAMGITVAQFFCGNCAEILDNEERKLLNEWFLLSDIEKQSIFDIIEVFKILKS